MQGDETSIAKVDRTLDVSGESCPVPALKARRCLDTMVAGEVLEVIATDPLAGVDLQILCDRSGHEWLGTSEAAGELRVRIRVRPARRPGAD